MSHGACVVEHYCILGCGSATFMYYFLKTKSSLLRPLVIEYRKFLSLAPYHKVLLNHVITCSLKTSKLKPTTGMLLQFVLILSTNPKWLLLFCCRMKISFILS